MKIAERASWPVLLLLVVASSAFAHEVRPAYLELRQTRADTYEVLWKVPGRGETLRLALNVEFPADCTRVSEPRRSFANEMFIDRWRVRRAGGLSGAAIRIDGLVATMTDVLVRLQRLDGTTQVARLTPAAPAFVVQRAPRPLEVAQTYVALGIEHILFGFDHLLFVLALVLIVRNGWLLLKTITAFTLAHSITLTLATLGVVHVPGPPVEASIALSILLLASEVGRAQRGGASLTSRWPWVVAFCFGLLHGFGFASALTDLGLPQGDIPLALFSFNVGVELGQLAFIAVVVAGIAALRRINLPAALRRRALPAAGYGIGIIAAFWFFERLSGFFR
jgi:hydrogenase/urease accessory protein HupE